MPDPFRLVLDTNVLLSGLANRSSASGRILSLTGGYDDAARRFRQRLPEIRVLRPAAFLREFEADGT